MNATSALQVRTAKGDDFSAVLHWLLEENANGADGFLCKQDDIRDSFLDGTAMIGSVAGFPIAFALFYLAPPASGVQIVDVQPLSRRRGHGRTLMKALIAHLQTGGAQYVTANAVTPEGAAFCQSLGFEAIRSSSHTHTTAGPVRLKLMLSPQVSAKVRG